MVMIGVIELLNLEIERFRIVTCLANTMCLEGELSRSIKPGLKIIDTVFMHILTFLGARLEDNTLYY